MPIYEYRCSACGTTFEKLRKFSDPPVTECDCGEKGTVTRLMSQPAFHLKGGGWYKDGYGGKSANGGSEGKTESKPTSTETKGDTKAPAATEPKPSTSSPAPAPTSSSTSSSDK